MKIKYQINKCNYFVSIKKQLDNKFVKDIEKINSDKNILIVYDKNIKNSFIKEFHSLLKISGCKIFLLKLEGSKKKQKWKNFIQYLKLPTS